MTSEIELGPWIFRWATLKNAAKERPKWVGDRDRWRKTGSGAVGVRFFEVGVALKAVGVFFF